MLADKNDATPDPGECLQGEKISSIYSQKYARPTSIEL